MNEVMKLCVVREEREIPVFCEILLVSVLWS